MYEHFRPEERPFIDQLKDLHEQVIHFHQERLTDFLDPRQQDIVFSIIGKDDDCDLQFFGGADGCERKRAALRPSYLSAEPIDWEISLLKAPYSSKFVSISHRDVLGALMNTGMVREKFGDISVDDASFSFACTKEAEMFVRMSLEQVGKVSVTFEQVDKLNLEKEQWNEINSLVSSMRLDSVIAAVYGLSRSKAAEAIEKGIVKVNWRLVDDTAFRVDVGDYLSVRGYGRGKVISQEGITKKDKIRLVLGRKK